VRQVFFLLAAAMFVAFSLSWAAPSSNLDTYYAIPDEVRLPQSFVALSEKPEVFAAITLRDSCESVESISQETRGHKVIFSIKLLHKNNDLCLQHIRNNIAVKAKIEKIRLDSSRRIDIYFREDEENLKYFGAIEIKSELISQNNLGERLPY